MTTIRSSPDSTVSFLSNQEFGGEKWEEMEEAGWDYRQSAILGLAGDGYVIARKAGSHFALVWFTIVMITCLDLAAELLTALIVGHEERAEVRKERKAAGRHVKGPGHPGHAQLLAAHGSIAKLAPPAQNVPFAEGRLAAPRGAGIPPGGWGGRRAPVFSPV